MSHRIAFAVAVSSTRPDLGVVAKAVTCMLHVLVKECGAEAVLHGRERAVGPPTPSSCLQELMEFDRDPVLLSGLRVRASHKLECRVDWVPACLIVDGEAELRPREMATWMILPGMPPQKAHQ